MAPISKHYPIATSIFSCIPSSSGKPSLLPAPQLNSSSSLAHLLNHPINDNLKKVIRHLKNFFPDCIVSMDWAITVSSTEVACKFSAEIMVRQVLMQPSTMQEALRFLNMGFLYSQALLMSITKLCDASDIDEAELAKLKKLKEHLIVLIGCLDKVLIAYFHIKETKNLPDVSKVKRMAKKLRKNLMRMKPETFSQLMPNGLVTEEDILCLVLGLQHDVADRLKDLNPEVRRHQSDMYFLQRFLADQDASPEIGECLTNTEAVSSKLQEMGFTKCRSVVIAKWIAEQCWAEHRSLLAWAQHYIENLFAYDIFLNDHVARYPYQENKQNEWFLFPVERYGDEDDDDDDDGDEDAVVKIINTNCETPHDFINEIEQEYKHHTIYYHGTDHLSAKSIVEDGINLGMGTSGCDFSSGSGFYLADSSKYAIEWAKKSTAAAVLMFCISEDCLNGYKIFDLSNESQKGKLREVRNHFRSNEKLSKSTRQEYRKCDYIKGPLDSIPDGITQICIKSEEMALCIGNAANICAVIFMNEQETI